MFKNILFVYAIWCTLENTIAAHSRKNHKDHKNKRDLTTIDGVVYNEFVVTSTLPPVTVYSTSYWTSYWTSVLTQYSTVVIGDFTSTKTLVTPTTYAVVSSSSVATTQPTSGTVTLSPTSTSNKRVTTSIDASELLNDLYGSSESTTTYFQNVTDPYFMTTVADGTTKLYFFEDVYYDTNGTPTATQFEKYVGTDNLSDVLNSYVSSTVYSTSTSTLQKTITITTSV